MKTWKGLPLLAVVALGTGCIGDDVGGDGDSGDTGTNTMTMTTASMTMTTAGEDTTTGMTMGGTLDTTAGDDDDDDDDDESSSGGDDPTIFIFDETPPGDYTQIERKGFPAINTGLNLLGDKDAYNASNPAEDINGDDARDNAEASIITLHAGVPGMQTPGNTGLDDDIIAATFEPCSIMLGGVDCLDQAGPFALPDTLNVTTDGDGGNMFPNGRRPFEPVMDIILAILLLDVGEPPAFGGSEPLTRFHDIDDDGTPGPSLNPVANDVAFPMDWPYLAPAHEP